MTCRLETREVGQVHVERYSILHAEGTQLIRGWIERGVKTDGLSDTGRFEAFIFLWIGFNAWGACVTGEDRDIEMVDSLAHDRGLNHEFARLVSDGTSDLGRSARSFQRLWPIFRVQGLRELGVHYWPKPDRSRSDVVSSYLKSGATKFDPDCAVEHHSAGDDVPLDWAHVLKAIYRVRCNLFHGEKASSSEGDRIVVRAAHRTLSAFVTEADLIA